jgi:enoyl-CoA hydratase
MTDSSSYETLLYTVDGPTATVTLNRPEHLNTIVPPMPDELERAVGVATRDDEVKVIVVRGAGRAFCAGYDFGGGFEHWKGLVETEGRWDPGKDFVGATAPQLAPTQKFMSVWRCPKPVIAQVHGWCVGGGSDFALCADLVVASEDAVIGTPYSRMWGAYLSGMWIYRLGLAKAKEHALTGRPLSGRQAAEIELINRAVPFAELEATGRDDGPRSGPDPVLAAGGDEAVREPCIRDHGRGRVADAWADSRRADAQHAARGRVHPPRRDRRCPSRRGRS